MILNTSNVVFHEKGKP